MSDGNYHQQNTHLKVASAQRADLEAGTARVPGDDLAGWDGTACGHSGEKPKAAFLVLSDHLPVAVQASMYWIKTSENVTLNM